MINVNFLIDLVGLIISILIIIICVLIGVAYLTLLERKVMAAMQRRKGPNYVGIFGLLQPFADGMKLLIKEAVIPLVANKFLFMLAPILTLFLSLASWSIIPFFSTSLIADINIGVLYIYAISSLGVYGIIISGWSSNSKYAFLGSLRSAAQMISYEVSLSLILIIVLVNAMSLNLNSIILSQNYLWNFIYLFPFFSIFFISALAETNRPPFDLPEAEAELVAGYNVEYSSAGFTLFFIGEYSNIMLMCSLLVILFFGGWTFSFSILILFGLKVLFFLFSFIWVRASFPRYRYDQLMYLGWKVFLPITLGGVILISCILFI